MRGMRSWWMGVGMMGVAACVPKGAVPEGPVAEVPAEPAEDAGSEDTTLRTQLEARKAAFAAGAPDEVKQTYAAALAELEASGLVGRAKQVGEAAPDFVLPNATGGTTALADLLERGPVVLLWYRGGWCPYCNLTLHAYKERAAELAAAGATLVAISPENPDNALSTAEKHDLPFEVLSDGDNVVAKAYGTVFDVPPEVWSVYQAKLNVDAYYDHDRAELPLAATYVVAPDGTIAWAYLDADYRNRAEPEDVIAAVRALK